MTFDEFLEANLDPLARFSAVLIGDRLPAEDVLQSVLERAFVRWDVIGQARDTRPYVRRMVIKYFSWRRRGHRLVFADNFEDLLPARPDFPAAT